MYDFFKCHISDYMITGSTPPSSPGINCPSLSTIRSGQSTELVSLPNQSTLLDRHQTNGCWLVNEENSLVALNPNYSLPYGGGLIWIGAMAGDQLNPAWNYMDTRLAGFVQPAGLICSPNLFGNDPISDLAQSRQLSFSTE